MAENSGGVQEKTVTLTFDDPAKWPGTDTLSPDQKTEVQFQVTQARH